jgi:FlaA1/EpsC-like NDP-sugar epimerase
MAKIMRKFGEKYGNQVKTALLMLLDAVMINASMILALQLRFDMQPEAWDHIHKFWNIAPIMTVLTIGSFLAVRLYKSIWRYASVDAFLQIVLGTLLGSGATYLFSLIAYTISPDPNLFLMPRTVYLIDWLILLLLVGASRLSMRLAGQWEQTGLPFFGGRKGTRVMVIGAGWAGASVIRDLQSGRYGQSRAILALDDDPAKKGTQINRVPVYQGIQNVEKYARQFEIDEIIIAIAKPKGSLKELMEQCMATRCRLKMVSALRDVGGGQDKVTPVRDVNIADLLGRTEQHLDMTEAKEFFQGKSVLVTGGGGSIGSELCRQIMGFAPRKLTIYDISENYMHDLYFELQEAFGPLVKNTVELCVGSIQDRSRLDTVFGAVRPEIVIHAAAHKHVPLMEECPEQAVKNNVFGTFHTAQCAIAHGVKRFVLISTDKAVNPTNVMGATKRAAEMVIEALQAQGKTEFTAVRFGNVLGSHGSVVPKFERQIRLGGPVTLTHPDIIRYFMTIPEAAGLVLQAASMARGGELFVLDMGEPVKIRELAQRMIQLYADPSGPPVEISYVGLRPGEKLYEELLRDDENITRTSREKIFIAKPEEFSWETVQDMLDKLDLCLSAKGDMRSCLHELIPSYLDADEVNDAAQTKAKQRESQDVAASA